MNRYKPDGFHAIVPSSIGKGATSLQNAYRNPLSIAGNGGWEWCTDNPLPSWGTAKTIHDPCPAGWRVPQKSELKVLVDRNATAIPKSAQNDGGVLLNYDDTGNKFYIRFTGYPPAITQLNNVGLMGYATAVEGLSVFRVDGNSGSSVPEIGGLRNYDAHTTRCVQEKIE